MSKSTDHAYLEEVEGKKALAQVRAWNARSLKALEADPRYEDMYRIALDIANSDERIPYGHIRAGHIYNFWQDEKHTRGIWRRTDFSSYAKAEPEWEILLDIDALAKKEKRNWVFKGATCTPDRTLCMLALSDGGKDAVQMREFDVRKKSFVEAGFLLPEAKSQIVWVDTDTLLVATDWGPGSLTSSGYPFIVKRLDRGQKPSEAAEVLRGEKTDVGVWPRAWERDGKDTIFGIVEADTFFTSTYWAFGTNISERPVRLSLPPKSTITGIFRNWLVVSLEQDWQASDGTAFLTGDLIALALCLPGPLALELPERCAQIGQAALIFRPGARQAVSDASISKDAVLLTINDNVVGKILAARPGKGRIWQTENVALPSSRGSASVRSASVDEERAFISYQGFLTPNSLYQYDAESRILTDLKSLPEEFQSSPYKVEQFEAISTDGQAIPYFLVRRKGAHRKLPTLLYGYGGFQISLNPAYSAYVGRMWLEKGGAYAVANIRGGGEFGPKWHQAGLKTKRQIVYDDFISVAEDLIARKITSPDRLGIMGGSNGGLLMGVMYTQRPDLWEAVVCQVPLLDMLRYHTLLAGASWVDEYGSPDIPEERAWLEKMSPYHNVDADDPHPDIFFLTSTKDDRVHPGHARKMAKRLEELDKTFLYYENIDGGHSAAANRQELARRKALEFIWLTRKLIDPHSK